MYVNGPSVIITDTDIISNTVDGSGNADGFGGGLALQGFDGGASLNRVTVSGNQAEVQSESRASRGGGIYIFENEFADDVEILNSSIIYNNSVGGPGGAEGVGGGVAVDSIGLVIFENTTISGNEASTSGGGVYNDDSRLFFEGVTVTENTSTLGGGLNVGESAHLRNTIVVGNDDFTSAASNIEGDVDPFSAYNLLGVGGAGGLSGGARGNVILASNDAELGGLQNNGGSTLSHLPLTGSLAIDAGDLALRYSPTEFDQRGAGFPRVLNGRIDIGAVESQGPIVEPPIDGTADIVLLVDQSGSTSATQRSWINDVAFAVESALAEHNIANNRYALVGFGSSASSDAYYAFSHLLGTQLFSDATTVARAVASLDLRGDDEDGWDAIEHAVAEYDFREGAAVHIMLVTDEKRENFNSSLTPDVDPLIASAIAPVLAARDASLTVVAPVQFTADLPADVVFGVFPSETADHASIEYDNDTAAVLTSLFNENTESFNPSFFGAGAEDQYVRLAWESGGSAWNVHIIEGDHVRAAAFSEEFAREFALRTSTQETYVPGQVVAAINFGGSTSTAFPDAAPSIAGSVVTTEIGIDLTSGSISVDPGDAFDALQSAVEVPNGSDLSFAMALPNGPYDVELFFAEIDAIDRLFDVVVEDITYLNNYQISEDRSRITVVDPPGGIIEIGRLDVSAAGFNNGAVKVFRTEVVDGVLNVDLKDAGGAEGPMLNAIRILGKDCPPSADFDFDGDVNGNDVLIWQGGFGIMSGAAHSDGDADCDGDVDGNDFLIWQAQFSAPPGAGSGPTVDFVNAVKVTDVIISGSTSTHAPFSMSTVEGSGAQLATVPVGGADTISIVFSEHANVTAGDLDIVGLYTANEPNLVTFSYDVYSSTATWTFDGWSLGDQYAITLADSVTDLTTTPAGNTLDGEWTNPAHITTVNAAVSEFPSGDGTAGGDFTFVMTLLPGDANLDNKVDGADYMIWQANNGAIEALFGDADFNGDGVVDGNDFALWQQNTGSNLEALWILADLDGDFDVDYDDLMIMYANIGGTGHTWAEGDLNGDGVIDVNDYWLWLGQDGLDIDDVA